MKARKELKEYAGFVPFEIVLTVGSTEEARALYAIFNYSPNLALLPEEKGDSIREVIGVQFATSHPEEEIARRITYLDFYRPKVMRV